VNETKTRWRWGTNRWIILGLIILSVVLTGLYPPLRPHVQLPAEQLTGPLFTLPVVGEFSLSNTIVAMLIADLVLIVLALLVLPTIIIAARAALKAVPPSIKEAALGVGASHQQAVFHHVLPLAMPGIMTGTIIGMAHALGETAPLLMIGMVAFVVDIPHSILQPATALPVQVFLWADSPERAFEERAAAAIIVLLAFTCLMNLAAVILRKKFEVRW